MIRFLSCIFLVSLCTLSQAQSWPNKPVRVSQAHVALELLKLRLGLDIVRVPYQGVGPAIKDLLGGRITMMVAQVPSALPHIKAGKLRALGVASSAPLAALPDVPTIAKVLQMPDVREKLDGMGAEPSGESSADLAARIKGEYDYWGEVVKKANIKAD